MSKLADFVGELRRRKVFRVAAMYVVLAWALIEVASVIVPELQLPSWSVRLMIVLAVFGLPLAVLLAWIFDITPQGVQRTDALDTSSTADVAQQVALTSDDHSLAVLPFANIGDDESNEYFSDGLAEDLLNRLGRVDGLRVVARSSAFSFRDRGMDVRMVAQTLGVSHVLEGSVRRAENKLRVVVRLVRARDLSRVWSETYDRELGDTFRIQDEISTSVFNAFNYQFADTPRPALLNQTDDIEAYHLYLMGRHQFHKRTPETLDRAIEYFDQAIALDPDFALPYTGLSDAYALSSASGEGYGNRPVAEALARAQPLVDKALLLDPQLAEAHASLGMLCRLHGDLNGAEIALRRSLELNGSYPLARTWLALTLVDLGRLAEASEQCHKAVENDPLSSIAITNLGFDRLKFQQFEEARKLFQRVLDLNAEFPPAHVGLATIELQNGNLDDAIRNFEKAANLSPRRAFYRALLGAHRIELGQLDEAARDIARAAAIAPDEPAAARAKMALLIATDSLGQLREYTQERLHADATPESYANAALASLLNGDAQGARDLYEKVGPELDLYVTRSVVWSWRFPHTLLYALALRDLAQNEKAQVIGDTAARQLADLRAQGLQIAQIDYLEAAIAGLRGRPEDAGRALDRALAAGWSHRWWLAHDPLLAGVHTTKDGP